MNATETKIEWLSSSDAADAMGVSRSALCNAMRKAGDVPGLRFAKFGSLRAWHIDDVDLIRRIHCMDASLHGALKITSAIRQGEFDARD